MQRNELGWRRNGSDSVGGLPSKRVEARTMNDERQGGEGSVSKER